MNIKPVLALGTLAAVVSHFSYKRNEQQLRALAEVQTHRPVVNKNLALLKEYVSFFTIQQAALGVGDAQVPHQIRIIIKNKALLASNYVLTYEYCGVAFTVDYLHGQLTLQYPINPERRLELVRQYCLESDQIEILDMLKLVARLQTRAA